MSAAVQASAFRANGVRRLPARAIIPVLAKPQQQSAGMPTLSGQFSVGVAAVAEEAVAPARRDSCSRRAIVALLVIPGAAPSRPHLAAGADPSGVAAYRPPVPPHAAPCRAAQPGHRARPPPGPRVPATRPGPLGARPAAGSAVGRCPAPARSSRAARRPHVPDNDPQSADATGPRRLSGRPDGRRLHPRPGQRQDRRRRGLDRRARRMRHRLSGVTLQAVVLADGHRSRSSPPPVLRCDLADAWPIGRATTRRRSVRRGAGWSGSPNAAAYMCRGRNNVARRADVRTRPWRRHRHPGPAFAKQSVPLGRPTHSDFWAQSKDARPVAGSDRARPRLRRLP